jgi:hypothetical protein
MNAEWFAPVWLDFAFDLFRNWIPSEVFDIGYFIKMYDKIEICEMNFAMSYLENFSDFDFSFLGRMDEPCSSFIEGDRDGNKAGVDLLERLTRGTRQILFPYLLLVQELCALFKMHAILLSCSRKHPSTLMVLLSC